MRIALDLNEELMEQAHKLTNIKEKTDLIHEALRVLIAKVAQKELAVMGGTQKRTETVSRRTANRADS